MTKKVIPSISAVIIAKNEASMIANCIETLRWCSEVIVIDNGSEDQTAAIATDLGARVVAIKSESFADLRNRALKYTKTDWVMYIDADERVTPQLSQEIMVHIETDSGAALRMKRLNRCYGTIFSHGGWQTDWVTRVFKRKQLQHWAGKVHESPVYDGETVNLHSELLHFTHRSTTENLEKSRHWTAIEAELLFEAGAAPVTVATLLRKSIMEVIRRVFIRRGYQDGMAGWIEGLTQGWNRFLVYVQLWELQQTPSLAEQYQAAETEVAALWKQAN